MKKLLTILALAPALAFAQSYPGPTFRSVTVNSPADGVTQGITTNQSTPSVGSAVGPYLMNYFVAANNYNITGSNAGVVGIYEQFNTGGSNQKGRSIGMFLNQNHGTASSSGADHIALATQEFTNVADTSGGEEYSYSGATVAANGANVTALVGIEQDMEIDTGATVPQRWAIRAVNQGANAASGNDDSAFAVLSTTVGGGFKHAFLLSNAFTQPPLQTTGDVFAADASMTVANWANLSNLTVTGNILSFPNATLTGAGGLTLAQGIAGVTNGSAAPAGYVGENPSNSTGSVSMTTATPANCTSVSLTAGDWEIWGTVQFNPAGSTTVSALAADISTTSATFDSTVGNSQQLAATFSTGTVQALATPHVVKKFTITTTAYLIGQANFATSTMTCSGAIQARRIY